MRVEIRESFDVVALALELCLVIAPDSLCEGLLNVFVPIVLLVPCGSYVGSVLRCKRKRGSLTSLAAESGFHGVRHEIAAVLAVGVHLPDSEISPDQADNAERLTARQECCRGGKGAGQDGRRPHRSHSRRCSISTYRPAMRNNYRKAASSIAVPHRDQLRYWMECGVQRAALRGRLTSSAL